MCRLTFVGVFRCRRGTGRCVSWAENKVKQVLGGWPGSMHKQLISCLNFVDVKFFRMTGGMS